MTIQQLGHYQLKEKLGEGGFGTVYRAYDPVLNVDRAIKVLHAELMRNVQFIERFKAEAQLLAQMRHPNIVGVQALAEADNRLFIVMDLLPGGSLSQRLNRDGKFDWPTTLKVTQDIAAGLTYAHEDFNLVHRDLKPSNILFDAKGNAVLTDFGFAKLLADNPDSFTATGSQIGTPNYMAPEQWEGDPDLISPATDVYALSCIVSEMLTGKMLFDAKTPVALMKQHVMGEPTLPKVWPEGAKLAAIALPNGLAKAPTDRIATAKALVTALTEVPVARPAQEPDQDVAPPTAYPVREARSILPWLAAGIGVVLLAGVGLFFGLRDSGAEPAIPASGVAEVTQIATSTPTVTYTSTALPTATFTPTVTNTPEPTALPVEIMDMKGHVMRLVPEGEFTMGSALYQRTLPVREVFLDNYYIDVYEVTNSQYATFLNETNSIHTEDVVWISPDTSSIVLEDGVWKTTLNLEDHPVVGVSWYGASAYCAWRDADLPSEAQWENAARGPQNNLYPWGNIFDGTFLNYCDASCENSWGDLNFDDGATNTAPVGTYPQGVSHYGLLDMVGNVAEWTSGEFEIDPDASSEIIRYGSVVRGGSWFEDEASINSVLWRIMDISIWSQFVGFRCSLAPENTLE